MIVKPESVCRRRRAGAETGHEILLVRHRRQREKGEGDCGGPDHKTIHVVEKIDGVENEEQPEHRCKPGEESSADEKGDLDTPPGGGRRRNEELPEKFHARFHGVFVVPQSEHERGEGAEAEHGEFHGDSGDSGNAILYALSSSGAVEKTGGGDRQENGQNPCGKHGQSSEQGRCISVEFMLFGFRHIHAVREDCQAPAERREHERHREAEYEYGKIDLNPIQGGTSVESQFSDFRKRHGISETGMALKKFTAE